jgi:hypothetical protein
MDVSGGSAMMGQGSRIAKWQAYARQGKLNTRDRLASPTAAKGPGGSQSERATPRASPKPPAAAILVAATACQPLLHDHFVQVRT